MFHAYFAASLPAIALDSRPPFSEDEFAASCRQHLSSSDFAAFEALRSGGKTKHPFVVAWRALETQLRGVSAKIRAAKLGVSGEQWRHPHESVPFSLESAVTAAFAESNPLKRDLALKKILWNGAEEIAGLDTFSSSALFSYFVRLRIIIARANADAGFETGKNRLLSLSTKPSSQK